MRMQVLQEFDVSFGSGGCWFEVEIDFNYIPGDAGSRWEPPCGDTVEAVTYRIRKPIGRPENGKWKMTAWEEPPKAISDLIEECLDVDWLVGEARDAIQADAEAEADYRYDMRMEAAE